MKTKSTLQQFTKLAARLIGVAAFLFTLTFAAQITQGELVQFVWEHEDKLPLQVYEDGALWRTFSTNEIFAFGTTNGVTTWGVSAFAPKGGREYRFAGILIDPNGVPSGISNTATQYIRILPPGRFGIKDK